MAEEFLMRWGVNKIVSYSYNNQSKNYSENKTVIDWLSDEKEVNKDAAGYSKRNCLREFEFQSLFGDYGIMIKLVSLIA